MAGLNYTAMSSSQTSQTIYGINTDIGKSFLKGKLTGHLGIASNRSNLNSTMGWVNTGTLSVNYRPHPKHSFKLNFSQIQNLYPENSSVKSFSETKVMFSYALKI